MSLTVPAVTALPEVASDGIIPELILKQEFPLSKIRIWHVGSFRIGINRTDLEGGWHHGCPYDRL